MKNIVSIMVLSLIFIFPALALDDSVKIYQPSSLSPEEISEANELDEIGKRLQAIYRHFNSGGLVAPIDELAELAKELHVFGGDWSCRQTQQGLVDYYKCAYEVLGMGTPPPSILNARQKILETLLGVFDDKKTDLIARFKLLYAKELSDPNTPIERYHSLLCTSSFSASEKLNAVHQIGPESIDQMQVGNKYLLATYLEISISDDLEQAKQEFCVLKSSTYIALAKLK